MPNTFEDAISELDEDNLFTRLETAAAERGGCDHEDAEKAILLIEAVTETLTDLTDRAHRRRMSGDIDAHTRLNLALTACAALRALGDDWDHIQEVITEADES